MPPAGSNHSAIPCVPPRNAGEDYFGRGYYKLYRNYLIPREQSEAEARFLLAELAPARGERWLDLPCGYGRHLLELRRLAPSLRVTGGERNPHYLRERGLRRVAALACCDMRRLPWADGAFDAVLNLLNSFGYDPARPRGGQGRRTPPGDRTALEEWARVLRPGGRLALDLPDRLGLLRLVRRQPCIRYCMDGHEATERFAWDAAGQCLLNRTRWSWPGGGEEAGYRLRLYTPRQIEQLLGRAGFRILRSYGDFQGNPYQPGRSDRLLLICRRD